MQISFKGNYAIKVASTDQAQKLQRNLSSDNSVTALEGKVVKLLTGHEAQDYKFISSAAAKVFSSDNNAYDKAMNSLDNYFDKKGTAWINLTA